MKHNRSFVLLFCWISLVCYAGDDTIKKMKEDRDKIAELKEEICKEVSSSRSECFKQYLKTVQLENAPEFVLLTVAITDMYARDRFQWEEKEIAFRFMQIENWFGAIERIEISKPKIKAEELPAFERAKVKLMAKAREELKILYEILSKAKDKETPEQKQKYRELLQQFQKWNDLKFIASEKKDAKIEKK